MHRFFFIATRGMREIPGLVPSNPRRNTGFVNVGTDHDTGEFAVASIRGWWRHEGRRLYPSSTTILIAADGGGSNGWRLRLN